MPFLIALLILIILVLLGYGLIYYLGRKQTQANIELDEQKQEIMSTPVADKLYTLRNKNVSGATRRVYESEQAKWQTITRFRLPEIEAALVSAQDYTDKYNIVKARSVADEVETILEETKDEVNGINDRLTEILASEKASEDKHEETYDRYASLRKQLLAHGYKFGDALETLEHHLAYIELDFTKYHQQMNDGDFIGAQEALVQIDADLNELEQMMEMIPDLYTKLNEEYVEQVADMQQGFAHMVDENFQFPMDVDIPKEISVAEKKVAEAKKALSDADLTQASELMEAAGVQIDQTYTLMEKEIASREYIGKNQGAVQRRLEQVTQSNRYGALEIDRVAQNYLLYDNEMGKMQEYADQIERQKDVLKTTDDQLAEHQIAYSDMETRYREIYDQLTEIDKGQSAIVVALANLRQRERDARDDLYMFELDLRNIKRSVEIHHLPGLTNEYLDYFFDTSDRIDQLSESLNRVKLDMVEIENLTDQIAKAIEYLDEETEKQVRAAQLTESAIQYANRYRPKHPELNAVIERSYYLFDKEFLYEDAFENIARAVDQIQPGARQEIIQQYDKENQVG